MSNYIPTFDPDFHNPANQQQQPEANPYNDWDVCPLCGGDIVYGNWSYDSNLGAQEQERSCENCGFTWHAVYTFTVNLDEDYEDFGNIFTVDDDDIPF